MHYVVILDNELSGIMPYEPAVPDEAEVITISDEDFEKLNQRTHYFDLATKSVREDTAEKDRVATEAANKDHYELLNTTDWKVLRHMRQKALGIETTLSEEEYLDLERARQTAAESINNA